MDINKLKEIYAVQITTCSLVGINTSEMPVGFGNYFSVLCSDGKNREIANMWYENFQHILKENSLIDEDNNFQVKIKILDERWALVHDIRFPHNYYSVDLSYRTPHEYWSTSALLKRQRDIDSGELIVKDGHEIIKIKNPEPKKLAVDWTITEEIGVCFINPDCFLPKEKREEKHKKQDEERKKIIKLALSKYDEEGELING
jgi:hypothetical protein